MKKNKIIPSILLVGLSTAAIAPVASGANPYYINVDNDNTINNIDKVKEEIESNDVDNVQQDNGSNDDYREDDINLGDSNIDLENTSSDNISDSISEEKYIEIPFMGFTPKENGTYKGKDVFLINSNYNWVEEIDSITKNFQSGDKLTYKDFFDIYLEALKYGPKFGDVYIHPESFNFSVLNSPNLDIRVEDVTKENITINSYKVIVSLKNGYVWKVNGKENKSDIVFDFHVNNLPIYRDADIYKLTSLEYWGYLYVDFDESYPYVKYMIEKHWDQISKDLYEFLRPSMKNAHIRLSERIIRRTSYGWMFYIDILPNAGHEFVESIQEYKTTTVSVIVKNAHFKGDNSKPTYPQNVTRVTLPWDDYYYNYNNVSRNISTLNVTKDLIYTPYIVKKPGQSNYEVIEEHIPKVLTDLKRYLEIKQNGYAIDVGVETSTFIDNGISAKMMFFAKPISGFHWPDGSRGTKWFYVSFANIVTEPPTSFIPYDSFIQSNVSYVPEGIKNPQKIKSWGFVDHFYSNQHIQVENETKSGVFKGIWDQINFWWYELSEELRRNWWSFNCDISASLNEIEKTDKGWVLTLFVTPKLGYAWTDGTRDPKPIRVNFKGISMKPNPNPSKRERFYAVFNANGW